MYKYIFLTITLFTLSHMQANAQKKGLYAIKNVTVLSMLTDKPTDHQTVVIEEGVIKSLGSVNQIKIPKEAEVIDGTGKFLMPGLFDMHTHFMYEQGIPLAHAYTEAGWMLANGITTARIMNGSKGYQQIQKDIRNQKAVGPELWVTSPQFMGNWPWKEDTITPKIVVRNATEAAIAVQQVKADGYDAIKITQFIDPATYDGIITAAKKEGMKVTGHVGPRIKLPHALGSGQQIEHMDEFIEMLLPDSMLAKGAICVSDLGIGNVKAWDNVAYLQEDKIPALVASIKQTGMYVTPTNYFFMMNFGIGQTEEEIKATPGYSLIPETLLEEKDLRRKNYWEKKKISANLRTKWLDLRKKLTLALQKAGIPLMCGSDAPEWYMVQGFALHLEMEMLAQCGLSNYEVLQTATVHPASYLGISKRLGTIEAGKEADLLLLEANPLEDIRNTRKINALMANGKLYGVVDIQKLLKK